MKVNNVELKIKKRFYIFLFFVILSGGFILYSNRYNAHKMEDSQVLAATDADLDTYSLVEPNNSSVGNKIQNDIAKYEPVTISHTVEDGDTLQSIAQKYHADPQTIVDYPYNKLDEDFSLTKDQIIIIPNGYVDTPPPDIPVAIGSGLFSWPARGMISQYAFWWHPGAIDIAIPMGTPIAAAYPGKVVSVQRLGTGYGWHVIIEHSGGYTTLYGHMSRLDIVVGQVVSRGTMLGLSGSTGRSTGPHLHFEVKKQGNAVDPMSLLPSD